MLIEGSHIKIPTEHAQYSSSKTKLKWLTKKIFLTLVITRIPLIQKGEFP